MPVSATRRSAQTPPIKRRCRAPCVQRSANPGAAAIPGVPPCSAVLGAAEPAVKASRDRDRAQQNAGWSSQPFNSDRSNCDKG